MIVTDSALDGSGGLWLAGSASSLYRGALPVAGQAVGSAAVAEELELSNVAYSSVRHWEKTPAGDDELAPRVAPLAEDHGITSL